MSMASTWCNCTEALNIESRSFYFQIMAFQVEHIQISRGELNRFCLENLRGLLIRVRKNIPSKVSLEFNRNNQQEIFLAKGLLIAMKIDF